MSDFSITDVSARIMATYLAQMLVGLVTGFIFYFFSKSYKRKFLHTWSISWFAFAVYMFSMSLVLLLMAIQSPQKILFTFLAQAGVFLHLYFLLIGTYQFVNKRERLFRTHFYVVLLLLAFSFISVWAFSNDPTAAQARYLMRFGLRTISTALVFLVAAFIVWKNPTSKKGVGQKLLALFFFLFSLDQFFYVSIVVQNYVGISQDIPSFFGLIDMILISFIGMSMVMWLLEDEREKLKNTNHELDSFLYSTSHDLRAPLASILGLTNLSKHEGVDGKAKELMGMIEDRARKMDLVIDDILSLAKSKNRALSTERLDFNKFISEIMNELKFIKGADQVKLLYQENEENVFNTDRTQLKIILTNLISNGIKHRDIKKSDCYVSVLFEKTDKKILIRVEDNGRGIPKESQAKIFQMFFRASLNTDGTGLGLYISKEAVQKLRGEIKFESKEGVGTKFYVSLPLHA